MATITVRGRGSVTVSEIIRRALADQGVRCGIDNADENYWLYILTVPTAEVAAASLKEPWRIDAGAGEGNP